MVEHSDGSEAQATNQGGSAAEQEAKSNIPAEVIHSKECLVDPENAKALKDSDGHALATCLCQAAGLDTVYVFRDTDAQWRWHRKASNGRIISCSGEGYVNQTNAVYMAQRLNRDVNVTIQEDDS